MVGGGVCSGEVKQHRSGGVSGGLQENECGGDESAKACHHSV